MNANELADKLEKDGEGCTCAAYCAGECACDANWAEYHTKEAATMLRQQQAEIEALKEVIIKSKELLEQGEEVDFDDMMHIEILLEDACEVRELIEKTLNKGKDDGDE